MLELAIAQAVEHAERMLKTFRSGCAVAEDLLQLMIDKLEVVRQHAAGQAPHVASDPQFPGEPALSPSPEGVLVEGAGVVSTEHLAAAGVPIAAADHGLSETATGEQNTAAVQSAIDTAAT
jgi:hypothetical protein